MKYKIIIVAILILLGNQKTFSQNSSIRGKCIDDNSKTELFHFFVNFCTHSGQQFWASVEIDGSFEFEIGDEAGDIMVIIPNCYTIKILNIPSGFKQIDLGEIKKVASFYKHLFNMDGSLAYVH